MHADLVKAIMDQDYDTICRFLNTWHFSSDCKITTQRVDTAWIQGWMEAEKVFRGLEKDSNNLYKRRIHRL